MAKLSVFNSISLDGYFTAADGDLGWAHAAPPDPEWDAFVAGNAKGGGALILGRITYELMVMYWPTPAAKRDNPTIAEAMNRMTKVVFSKTLDGSDWENTRIVKSDPAAEVRKLKSGKGPDMVVLGSGTIVSQLTNARLIDEYQFVVLPIVLGKGRTMFDGVEEPLTMKQTESRAFKNGNVFLRYEPTG
jgi:dihydrofolate reductase